MIEEASAVARGIDPNLSHITFLSMADNKLLHGEYRIIEEPVLHCFHPVAGAFGYFLFDVLPIIAFFRHKILDSRMKILIPHLPYWCRKILEEIGIKPEHVIQLDMNAVLCRDVNIVSTMMTYNTFFPNPALTQGLEKALGLSQVTSWKSPMKGVYLSRANQNNYCGDRCLFHRPQHPPYRVDLGSPRAQVRPKDVKEASGAPHFRPRSPPRFLE